MPTVDAIRSALPGNPSGVEHAGLYYARWAAKLDDKFEAVKAVRKTVVETAVPAAYKTAYSRWKATGPLDDEKVVTLTAKTVGPLAVGMGNPNPSENGLTLHHTYGVPVIPGAALKGLTRRALQRMPGLAPSVIATLLGDSSESGSAFEGAVTFYDAWLVPEGVGLRPLHPDTITVHHPDYYKSEGDDAPTDFDDPIPIPFLVVKPGAAFLIRLSIDPAVGAAFAEQSLTLVKNALLWALKSEGVGGKTNAGYGRLVLEAEEENPIWENCTLRRVTQQGRQLLQVTRPDGARQIFPQRVLDAIRVALPAAQRNLLNAGVPGVRLRVEGESATLAPDPPAV